MKTSTEIRNKIDRLFDAIYPDTFEATNDKDIERAEQVKCQIDALLWVIGDRSGAPLIDEWE